MMELSVIHPKEERPHETEPLRRYARAIQTIESFGFSLTFLNFPVRFLTSAGQFSLQPFTQKKAGGEKTHPPAQRRYLRNEFKLQK